MPHFLTFRVLRHLERHTSDLSEAAEMTGIADRALSSCAGVDGPRSRSAARQPVGDVSGSGAARWASCGSRWGR